MTNYWEFHFKELMGGKYRMNSRHQQIKPPIGCWDFGFKSLCAAPSIGMRRRFIGRFSDAQGSPEGAEGHRYLLSVRFLDEFVKSPISALRVSFVIGA
jgi:hypothetical protein